MKIKRKRLLVIGFMVIAVSILGSIAAMYASNKMIISAARGKLFEKIDSVPFNRVGILLGTSKFLSNGYVNDYYRYRIDAALHLLTDSSIRYLVISGDNGRHTYNEPEMMRADLIKAGVDSTKIYLDYAGFRTFDSMVRLKEIFGVDSVTVISQKFHNERAIYTAGQLGIAAIGFNARDVSASYGFQTRLRERFARVKVMMDFAFGKSPKFLGEKIELPD